MKLPVLSDTNSLCDQCVALCCRYYAFEIDKPTTRRDFEDLRWFILHEDTTIFVEDGEWYLQINRKCKALLPDNRCGVYENRPQMCREYKTNDCDWHAEEEYEYDHVFSEPDQLQRFAEEYLAKARKRRAAAKKRAGRTKRAAPRPKARRRTLAKALRGPVRLLRSA